VSEQRYGVTSLVDLGHPVGLYDLDMALRQEFEALLGPAEKVIGDPPELAMAAERTV
jgi:lipoyl(octanoyl) transferase